MRMYRVYLVNFSGGIEAELVLPGHTAIAGGNSLGRSTYAGSIGMKCTPMLSPTRDPEALTDSFARWA